MSYVNVMADTEWVRAKKKIIRLAIANSFDMTQEFLSQWPFLAVALS